MTIYSFGSINADLFYHVDHLPIPGETLTATDHTRSLGGKGANQSIAAARAGSRVVHIGAVGSDGNWAIDVLKRAGVDTNFIAISDAPTGHAIINLDPSGENSIVSWPGANYDQFAMRVTDALADAAPEDTLLMQNETTGQDTAATAAKYFGMRVIYSAAPFSTAAVRTMATLSKILIVNQIEAAQVTAELGDIMKMDVPAILITKGANGAVFHDLEQGKTTSVAGCRVDAIDTTGAGDTFAGYFAAAIDQNMDIAAALALANAAAALKVTRMGTADAIPSLEEVKEFQALNAL